jgi:hypothetical protein
MAEIATGPGVCARAQRKLREWVARYLPAELAGAVAALCAAGAQHAVSGSVASAAIAGTLGEGLGYYGIMVAREARHQHRRRPGRAWLTTGRTVRGVLVEFGPAEVVDSLASRPLLMYALTRLTGSVTGGVLLGKLAADVVFYGLVITAYELRARGEAGR